MPKQVTTYERLVASLLVLMSSNEKMTIRTIAEATEPLFNKLVDERIRDHEEAQIRTARNPD